MYAERRKRFLDAMGPGAVAILQGARLVARSNDTDFPFRQDSDFHYLTGFDHPHAVALLRTDGGPAYTLYVEPRDREREIWNGYRPGIEGAKADFGADDAHPIEALDAELPRTLEHAERVFHMLGRDPKLDAKLAEIFESLRRRSRQGLIPASQVVDPRSILHEMRLIKEPAEVEILRRASAITAEGHREAARLAHEGRFEFEAQAALEYAFRRRGSAGPAYTSICGGGRNATCLHYVANDQKLANGTLLLIDAACELDGYATDVTRTYPVGGTFAGAQRALYEVVLAAQLASLEAAKPGTTLPEIHQASVRKLTEGMISLGLLNGDVDDLIKSEAFRRYYMHGTSHWLGLDVHDVGPYTVGGKPRPLAPGMCFTVEPGLYVAVDDDKAPRELLGVGVRIEDDIVITADGHENLTAPLVPKHPADVEAWVRDAA
ncbi:MAG TPA: aminopeptidase P N-terminal domain-containing protein [Myxococcota bacterium]|nr:aminopeptidase P N-terminal domain-containing protein [Myxococcota bacterium]